MRKNVSVLIASLMLVFLFVSSSLAKPVNSATVLGVARTHLQTQEQFWRNRPFLAPRNFLEEQKYSISEVEILKGPNNETLLYIFDLSPEGFIAVSSDTDIHPVIAYSFTGRFRMEVTPNNVLLHLLKWDMENRLETLSMTSKKLNEENNLLWEKYLSEEDSFIKQLSSSEQYGPWLETTWRQGRPFNKYCPNDPNDPRWFRGRCVVGCTATAMAQIIYYWQYPDSVEFNYNDDYYTTEKAEIKIDEDADKLDFPNFDELTDMLSDIEYDGNKDEIAALSFACGISVKMDYGSRGSGAWPSSEAYKDKFKYAFADEKSGSDTDFYDVLRKNMEDGLPAQLSIFKEGNMGGHSIVADGFKDTGEYHLNFGWGDDSPEPINECWYQLPLGMPKGYSVVHSGIVGIYLEPNPPTPSAPTNVSATAGDGEVTISWDSVSGATSYNIYWATYSGVSKADYEDVVSDVTSPYTHTGLTNGTTCYYVVTAENSYGESDGSSEVSATPSAAVPGWIPHANMPTGGYWGATAVWNNMLYVIGGGGGRYSAIEAYDPISDSWVIKNDYWVGFLVRAITVGNVMYVLGEEGEFWKYTPSTDTWETLPDAPTPNWVSELAEVNGKIYVFGGYGNGSGMDSVWEYNPTSRVWTSKAPMPTGRYGSATAVIGNKIYVFGGNYGTSSNEVYDPSTDSWEIKSDLPLSLWGWDVAGPSGWRIVVVEAEDPGNTIIYDPITDTYEWGDEIPTPRDDFPMGDSINDSIFVAGGQAAPNKLESYQPSEVLETVLKKPKAAPSAAMMEVYMQKHKKMKDALLQAMEK